jgi:cytidylate kinase
MFRAVAYALQHTGINFSKPKLEESEVKLIENFFHDHRFQFSPAKGVLVQLDNLNLTDVIREHHVSKLASQISKHKVIRDFLAHWQRSIVQNRAAILDGRDIGTVIFPEAALKIFLTASPDERAKRRFEELQARGQLDHGYEEILNDIKERDHEDMTREIAPLKKAQDSVELDTTGKSIQEIVEAIVNLWLRRRE